jgi:uncharacterized membrane protein YphA (DoxX/SURF4 family)
MVEPQATCLLLMVGFKVTGAASGLVMLMVVLVWLRTGHSSASSPTSSGALLFNLSS